jgi:hypothetical protein
MKAKQRVPARRGRATRHFGCQRVGCDRISLRRASLRRKIPNRLGIRGMSAYMRNYDIDVGNKTMFWMGMVPP